MATFALAVVFCSVYLIYPKKYFAEIKKYSIEYDVDCSLVCGIIWAESKFNSDALSVKGARGLMQITVLTAIDTANRIGEKFDEHALYDPDYNVKLGTAHLKYLLRTFDTDVAICAYNAGEGNVKRWLSQGKTPQQFDFLETREYLLRVRRAQKIYKRLYRL